MIATAFFEVVSNQTIAPEVNHIRLKPVGATDFTFIPGQFITIHFEQEGARFRRSYSIASMPGVDQTIDFAASYVAGGIASAYLFALQVGDQVEVSGPFGRLILKDEPLHRLFLVATGTGITPYRSMLPALAERFSTYPEAKVFIMHGVRYRDDVLYAKDFLHWAAQFPKHFEYRAYLSRETCTNTRDAHEYFGHVQKGLDELVHTPADEIIYLCGNPNMIDDAFAQLQARGFATSQIRREKYISSK